MAVFAFYLTQMQRSFTNQFFTKDCNFPGRFSFMPAPKPQVKRRRFQIRFEENAVGRFRGPVGTWPGRIREGVPGGELRDGRGVRHEGGVVGAGSWRCADDRDSV